MNRTSLLAAFLASALPLALADDSSIRVLALPALAAEAVATPETTRLHAISDDGCWLLFTSASDRLVTTDLNAALDVFVFDRTTGQFSLVSTTPGGQSGKGTSFAGDLSANAGRVAFTSRASGLVAEDENADWDVVARDVTTGANLLVSATMSGRAGTGGSGRPQLSADGRYVLFESDASDLAAVTGSPVWALYRRDLETGQTVWASQDTAAIGVPYSRTETARMSPDGRCVAYVVALPAGQTNRLYWRDLETATSVDLSARVPAGFPDAAALLYGNVVLSDTARQVACRVRYGPTNAFLYYLLHVQAVTTLGRATNACPLSVPESLLGPELSADGRFVAYAQSMQVPGTTNVVVQVFWWDSAFGTETLVSSRYGASDFSDGHAFAPRLTPDGRYVAFLSDAPDLAPELTGHALRAFLWDGQTGTTKLLAELGQDAPIQGLTLSRNGAWLGVAAPAAPELTRIFLAEIATGQMTALTLQPAVTKSTTGRTWLAMQPSGVSGDGRYFSFTAVPAGSGQNLAPPQVYVHDTVAGTRQLVTQNAMGEPGECLANAPMMSLDGSRWVYTTRATNFDGGSRSGQLEPYVSMLADPRPRWLRPPGLSANAELRSVTLSPLGRYACVNYAVSGGTVVLALVDLQTWTFSPLVLNETVGLRSFSRDETTLVSVTGQGWMPAWLHVRDVPQLMLSTNNELLVWQSPYPIGTTTLTLSGDGKRVAFTQPPSLLIHDVVVVGLPVGQELFRASLGRASVSGLALSEGGRYIAWASLKSAVSPGQQVTWADVDSGETALVSVAVDGVTPGNGRSQLGGISANGRYVAFSSTADNLVADDQNKAGDVFLRDLWTGETLLVSRPPWATDGDAWAYRPFFSADGRTLFFVSAAPDLAPDDYNQAPDLFAAELLDVRLLAVIRRQVATGRTDLLWAGQPGRTYRVEFKDTVDDPAWQSLATGLGPDSRLEVDTQAARQRLFRIAEEL